MIVANAVLSGTIDELGGGNFANGAITHIATDAHANARLKVGYSVTDQICNGNVSFQSGNVTIKCNNIVFQGGTSVELGTELNVETR